MSTGLRAGTNNDGYLQVNGTDVLTALSSGRIGIGTTGPARKVEIVDTDATVLQLNSTSSDGTSLRILHSGNDKMYMGLAGDFIIGQSNNVTDSAIRSNGSLLLASGGGTERLRIESNGYVKTNSEFWVGGALPVLRWRNGSNEYATARINSNDLYFEVANAEKLRITSAGIVRIPDNGKFTCGASDDLQIYHDGANSYVSDQGTGDLRLSGNVVKFNNQSNTATMVKATQGGSVELNYDNSKKLETTTTGAKVTGALEVTQEYPTIRPTLDLNFATTKTLDRRITFTRDSLATYYGEDGLLKYATNNTPRFDHDPDTRESLGLLIEESSTNLISGSGGYGSDMRNGSNLGNAPTSSVVDGITLPDGTVGKVRRLQIHPSGNSGMRWGSTGGGNANTPYSASVWARATSGTATAIIDVNDMGNIGYSLTEEWVRMTVTGTRADAYQFMDVMGSAGHDFYLWGFQIENKGYVSSYIPVASNESNKTRAQDTAIIKGTNFSDFYNASESTIFFESAVAPVTNSKYFTFHGSDGGGTELIEAAAVSGPGVNIFTYADSTVHSNAQVTDSGATTLKYAAGIKANDINLAVNGTLGTTDTSSTQPDAIDKLIIGNYSSGNYYINTSIKRLSYYNKRLSNSQLQGLTQQ